MLKMERNKKKKIGVDFDDTLAPCTQVILDMAQSEFGFNPPLSIEEVSGWLPLGSRVDVALKYFQDPKFFGSVKPYEGAKEFIHELSKECEIFFITAVPPEAMGYRAEVLMREFPEVPKDHYILTSAKDIIDLDILLDDAPHNLFATTAKYPICMRRPWNSNITGMLAVNNYDEALTLIRQINNATKDVVFDKDVNHVFALVGTSGSGKTTLAQELCKRNDFEQPISYTDRKKRNENDKYNFVTTEEFMGLKAKGDIFESTKYAGNNYGSSLSAIEKVLNDGKNAVIPVDMCGAMGIKSKFPNAITVFIDRDKRSLLKAIISRNTSDDEKASRIIGMDAEAKNAQLCDYIINNYGSVNDMVEDFLKILA